jgi:hypothetical protein
VERPIFAITIPLNTEIHHAILGEKITGTILLGHPNYSNGPVYLCCHTSSWVVRADITRVKQCELNEVSYDDHIRAGYNSVVDLLAKMKKFFPNKSVEISSRVTVIKWSNLDGKLVDDFDSQSDHRP